MNDQFRSVCPPRLPGRVCGIREIGAAVLLTLTAGLIPAAGADADEAIAFGAIGHSIAEGLHLRELRWTDAQFEAFVRGLEASRRGKPMASTGRAEQIREQIVQAIAELQQRGAAGLTAAAAVQETVRELGMQRTDSGLFVRVMRGGFGPRPRPQDAVILTLRARVVGTTGDLPALSREQSRVDVAALFPGLRETVQMTALGGHVIALVPPELSFAQGAWPEGVPPGSSLLFMVIVDEIIYSDRGGRDT